MEDRSPCKELVHKCNSDPGGGRRSIGIQEDSGGGGIARRTRSGSSYSHIPVARKCVLTLDGYSYVIGKCVILIIIHNSDLFYTAGIGLSVPFIPEVNPSRIIKRSNSDNTLSRLGFEPATPGLPSRRSDHCATEADLVSLNNLSLFIFGCVHY
ncbi:hypothetical protein WDU94_007898 [Cyamophila willieti]